VFNDNYMYFGGIPDETAILDRPGQLSTVDFVGCIKSISINGNEKNLIKESLNRTGNINLARQ
jgi:protocadherin Fat 4